MKLKELRQRMAALVTEERSQLEKIQKESRGFDATEKEAYEKRAADIATVEAEIQQLESVSDALKRNEERENKLSERTTEPVRPGASADSRKQDATLETRALRNFLRSGLRGLTSEETRALSAGSDVEGGYVTAPQSVVGGILQGVDNVVAIRNLATKYQLGAAESLGVPTLDTDVADADWTAELLTGNEDTSLRFGKRELRPHPLAKRIKVSKKLISSSTIDIVGYIQSRFGYKFGVTEEKGFMTGTGTMQPLGIFTSSTSGISTGRDVSTGNSTTAIAADNLIECKHTLKTQYWNRPGLRWIFHKDAVKAIRKLKDGNGQYLWQPGMTGGLPASIIEVPYIVSEYAPNTFTTGLYVGIIGDFSFYWIADCMSMQIQVLNELYAETNQVGYIARSELDGMPVLEEAFVRVKLA